MDYEDKIGPKRSEKIRCALRTLVCQDCDERTLARDVHWLS